MDRQDKRKERKSQESGDLLPVKNASYARYEELLLQWDQLKKQAFQYQRSYTAEFGAQIISVFEQKIACIRKKKTIEYCQRAANYGKNIDQDQLQAYLQQEMAAFQQQLDDMMRDTESAQKGTRVSEYDMLQIKKIYHRLAKLIHPDINPAVAESEELQDLWQRIVVAYDCNRLKELEELEVLVLAAIEKIGLDRTDLDIPNLDDKITELEAEIKRITETDPYLYKFLLEDEEAIADKKKALTAELRSYQEYAKQLDEILQNLLEGGLTITWQMN